jgi:hypothetical protein
MQLPLIAVRLATSHDPRMDVGLNWVLAVLLEHIDAGWELGEFSSTGAVFFCAKGAERRQVEITRSDPGHPAAGNYL